MKGVTRGSHLPRCPALRSLRRKATWVNRAGRVDRSACVEVRASEVWPRAQMKPVRGRRRSGPHAEAEGEIEITGRLLSRLHAHRMPFALMGDLRTKKSNVMKDPHARSAAQGSAARKAGAGRGDATRQVEAEWVVDSTFNPNKGASKTKLLGFFAEPSFMSGWSQTVGVVRWRSHARLAQHFLICPSCEEKYRKLFAVLCSDQELNDAATAEAWIEGMEARHAAIGRPIDVETMEFRRRLIARYALLFRRRRLVCRKCLGMRYGQVREKRQDVEASKNQHEVDADSAAQRESQRRRRRREYNREWRRVMKAGMPHIEKALAALARMRRVEDATRQAEAEGVDSS